MQSTSGTERINEMFHDLVHCNEDEQRLKIEEMIKERKVPLKDSLLMMKLIGRCKALKIKWNANFDASSLNER
ncbi:uncharacterized protein MONOS_16938 [Monocercomonoides exilis]|uniref:uncharacterized protein n=1 Tax=Monocercomonoides exilis TaxID=2049356 RepID=UPI00355A24D7|nr:hypothetical protein MONOS_16938 [Monocercomonoides exilis]